MRGALQCAILCLLCVLSGCGGGGASPPAKAVTISTPTTSVSLPVGGTQTFTAAVANASNTAVHWSILEASAGGTITSGGLYKAPAAAGVYHVVAISQADTSKSVTITITVHILIAVSPDTATVTPGESQTFTTAITGTTDAAVTWIIQEGAAGGTIDGGTGVYRPPLTPGTYHVVATSQFDPTQSAVATVTVPSGNATGTIQ